VTWNYRVIEFVTPEGEPWRAIHEVHYDDAGKPSGYTENPASIVWDEGLSEPRTIIMKMLAALNQPVLVETDFGRRDD